MTMSQQFRGFLPPSLNAQVLAGQFRDQDLNWDGEVDVSGLDYAAHMRLRPRKAKDLGIRASDNMVKARLELMFSNPNDQIFPRRLHRISVLNTAMPACWARGTAGKSSFRN